MEPGYDKETLREMVREVLREGLEERKGVFYDVLVEVLEDLTRVRAIAEGEGSETAKIPLILSDSYKGGESCRE